MAFYEAVDPSELTGFGQTIAESQAHLSTDSLAKFIPNENIETPIAAGDLQKSNSTGLANYRDWDTEGKINVRSRKRGRYTFELTPLSDVGFISERDRQLAVPGTLEERTRALLMDSAGENAINIGNRVELARADAIFKGKITMQDNGFVDEVDFGRPDEAYKVLDKFWDDATTDPLDDLEELVALRESLTGTVEQSAAIMSKRIWSAIRRSKSLRVSLGLPAGSRGRIGDEEINGLLSDIGIAEVHLYDYSYGPAGAKTRFTDSDKLALVPLSVDPNNGSASEVARTFWTRSTASMNPKYKLTGNAQFGTVIGAWEDDSSFQLFTKGDAVAVPAIMHPEHFVVAQVLPNLGAGK